ncbi:uncharacterized protein VTP21DRAFT_10670 [Calcarisporiella thermophila]|uniref:uncharacterized protein n=1 Tax=Calcarisporiella thermophila TaxID=911321 RepID=UPI0037445FC4
MSTTAGTLFHEFPDSSQLITESNTNAFALYCPQPNCNCLILRSGVGEWVERASIPLPEQKPTEGSPQRYWLIRKMMDFENIGFSKTVGTVKYLSCADCDVGPLGMHDTDGQEKEYLIAVDKVKYAPKK